MGADILFADGSLHGLTSGNVLGNSDDVEIDLGDHDTLLEGLGDGTQGKGRSQKNGSAGTHFE